MRFGTGNKKTTVKIGAFLLFLLLVYRIFEYRHQKKKNIKQIIVKPIHIPFSPFSILNIIGIIYIYIKFTIYTAAHHTSGISFFPYNVCYFNVLQTMKMIEFWCEQWNLRREFSETISYIRVLCDYNNVNIRWHCYICVRHKTEFRRIKKKYTHIYI